MSKTVTISGGGVHEVIRDARAYELVGLPADSYHKITLSDGTIAYYSAFGIRVVTIKEN